MVLIKDIIFSIFGAFFGVIGYFVDKTVEAGVQPDPLVVAAIVIVLTILIGSGALAGTVAGMRERSILVHGCIGVLIPYIYPLVLVFVLDVKGAAQRAKARKEEEKLAAHEEEMNRRTAGIIDSEEEEDVFSEERTQFNQEYFQRIARDENGAPTGPWVIAFSGNEMVVERICEPLPEVVVVEIRISEEETSRIRIPYARITSCEPG